MQKLKKAFKKLAGLAVTGNRKTSGKPSGVTSGKASAQQNPPALAKKTPIIKTKTQALVGKKTEKKPEKKPLKKTVEKFDAKAKKVVAKDDISKNSKTIKLTPKPVGKEEIKGKSAPGSSVGKQTKEIKVAEVAKSSNKVQVKPSVKATDKTAKVAAAKVMQSETSGKTPTAGEKKTASKVDKKSVEKESTLEAAGAVVNPPASNDDEVVLTDAEGRRYCRMRDCDQAASVDGGYCRFHYLLFWKNIQNRKKILTEGKLERYIEELTARYPDKYLELLRKDLRSEKDFMAAIQELEIDESGVDNDFEDEAQNYLDEVRGMSSEAQPERDEDF